MKDPFDFTPQSPRFSVIGNPIEHSLSPQIHQLFARQANISLEYSTTLGEPGGFKQAVEHFKASGGKGMNVTLPFKTQAFQLCDKTSDRAKLAQSVNTLSFDNDLVVGETTDGQGLVQDLQNNHGFTIKGSRVLIIGAGGAVRGVLQTLLEAAPKQLTICNRTQGVAMELAHLYADIGPITAQTINHSYDRPFDLVINGTSASLHNELPQVDDSIIGNNTLAYDMMYASKPSIFMKWALDQNAKAAVDGFGMLVEQAAASFNIWHGVKVQTQPVVAALRQGV